MVDELNVKEKMPTSGSVKKAVIFLHDMGLMEPIYFQVSFVGQLPIAFLLLRCPRKCGASPFGFDGFT